MANIELKFREACKQSGLASMLNQLNNQALNGLVSATLNILKQSAAGNSVTGTIKAVGQTVNVSKTGNEFLKRELVLDCSRYNPDDGTKIENYVQLSFTQKHCDDLNGFAVGEKVEVKFRLTGREYQGKYFNDVIGFGIERVDGGQVAQAPQAPQAPTAPAPVQAAPAPAPAPTTVPQAAPAPQNNAQDDSQLPF
jgi:hypothetical protein